VISPRRRRLTGYLLRGSYNFSTFSLANRALQASIKVSLRIDNEGFMSLQLMMPQPANKRVAPTESGIIEFKFRALEDE
jgi:cell cycle checkpoint protein